MTLVSIALGVIYIGLYESDVINIMDSNMELSTKNVANQIASQLNSKEEILKNIAKDPDIVSMDWDKQKKLIPKLMEEWNFSDIYVVNNSGKGKALDQETGSFDIDYSDENFFKTAKENGDKATYVEPFNYKGITFITIITPIKDGETIVGYILGDIDVTNMNKLLEAFKVGDTGKAFIIDKSGLYMAHIDLEEVEKAKKIQGILKNEDDLKKITSKNEVVMDIVNSDGKELICSSVKISEDTEWYVVLTVEENELLHTVSMDWNNYVCTTDIF